MWGDGVRQRLRLLPLYLALTVGDAMARVLPARRKRSTAPWALGLSVIIPERDAPAMLEDALASVEAALKLVTEPAEIVVVANGAPEATYVQVRARFPQVRWVHEDAPLGFSAAIARGLALARYGGAYLMNNDVRLEPRALAELLPGRAPDVFAIASQIMQRSADGRREETGFTDWARDRHGVQLFHSMPPQRSGLPAHLAASGGATLFRTERLRVYVRDGCGFDPFYWEDVDWSLRAWREGERVLFAPASIAHHRHRASTGRFYAQEEIARVLERNRLLIEIRHGIDRVAPTALMHRVCDLPYASQRELAPIPIARGVLARRMASMRPPQPLAPLALPDIGRITHVRPRAYSYGLRASDGTRPKLLLVTPFAVFPPRHGGARRVAEIIRGLRDEFDIALVTDEAALYDVRSFADFDGLCSVRLVQRLTGAADESTLRKRMRTHCHARLIEAAAASERELAPDIVQIEHAELAPLIAHRTGNTPWVLDLHDAYGSDEIGTGADAREFAGLLARFEALVVCSEEDRKLVRHRRTACIPNGATLADANDYVPSASRQLLFVGPFRYEPNYTGIVEFLRLAWPAIRAAVPDATLVILGGDEHAKRTDRERAFAQPGVTVHGHREDVPALLAQSALTINPITAIRGSAIKLAESIAAGRVCVSTIEGARGFGGDALHALVTVPDVAAMAGAVIELLRDPVARHRIESVPAAALHRLGWEHAVALQKNLYRALTSATEPIAR